MLDELEKVCLLERWKVSALLSLEAAFSCSARVPREQMGHTIQQKGQQEDRGWV